MSFSFLFFLFARVFLVFFFIVYPVCLIAFRTFCVVVFFYFYGLL